MEILVKLVRFGDTFLYGLFRLVNELIWESDSYKNCSRLPKLKKWHRFHAIWRSRLRVMAVQSWWTVEMATGIVFLESQKWWIALYLILSMIWDELGKMSNIKVIPYRIYYDILEFWEFWNKFGLWSCSGSLITYLYIEEE